MPKELVINPFDEKFNAPSKFIDKPGTVILALSDCTPKIAAGTIDQIERFQCKFVAYGYNDQGELIHGKETSQQFNPFDDRFQWIFINWLRAAYRDENGNPIEEKFNIADASEILRACGGRPFRATLERQKNNQQYLQFQARSFAPITQADMVELEKVVGEMGDPLAPPEQQAGEQQGGQGQPGGWQEFDEA